MVRIQIREKRMKPKVLTVKEFQEIKKEDLGERNFILLEEFIEENSGDDVEERLLLTLIIKFRLKFCLRLILVMRINYETYFLKCYLA